jgi:hypothetical protein
MAKKGHLEPPQAGEPPGMLPEPLEQASGLLNAVRQVYAWGRKHGLIAGVAAVCRLLAVLIWWGWPELKERPGIEPLAEWLKEIMTPLPACAGQNFCVTVANLQKDTDDRFGGAIVDAVENLQSLASPQEGEKTHAGIDVVRVPRTISTAGNNTLLAQTNALAKAQRYLAKSHADLIIWGVVVPQGDKNAPRIFWTTSAATSGRTTC